MRSELSVLGLTFHMRYRSQRRLLVLGIYLILGALLFAGLHWAPWTLTNAGLLILVVTLVNRMAFGGLSTRGLVQPFSISIHPIWFKDNPPPHSAIDRWFWRRSPARKDMRVDERDDRRRDQAHYLSHRILCFLSYVVWGLFAIVHTGPVFGGYSLSFDFALMIALATAMLAMTLPQAIMIWTEPDMEEGQ